MDPTPCSFSHAFSLPFIGTTDVGLTFSTVQEGGPLMPISLRVFVPLENHIGARAAFFPTPCTEVSSFFAPFLFCCATRLSAARGDSSIRPASYSTLFPAREPSDYSGTLPGCFSFHHATSDWRRS